MADVDKNSDGDRVGKNASRFDRRRFIRTVGAGTTAVSLAGCLTSSNGGDGGGGSGLPDTIKVGALAPVPSKNPVGGSIVNSAKLAAEQINNNDDVLPDTTVEVVVGDTKERASVGRTKYKELVRGEQVDVTTGVFTSEVLLAIMDPMKRNQTIHMGTGAATPDANDLVRTDYQGYKYFFRSGPINSYNLGVNMVDFLKRQASSIGWDSIAVLVEDYKWSGPTQQALKDHLGEIGIDVLMNKRYASGTKNFSPIYDEIEATGADAAYVGMAHTGTPAIVQWAKQQREFAFGGIHVPAQFPAYYKLTKGACRYAAVQNVATPQANVTEKTIPFADAYKEANGKYPVYTGYLTFDAVKQYAKIADKKGTTSEDEVINGLENMVYTGTSGVFEYYPKDHRFAHDPMYGPDRIWPVFMQWQKENGKGVQEAIHPDDVASAKYQSPPWV